MSKFDLWFKQQFGGLPNERKAALLAEKATALQRQLDATRKELDQLWLWGLLYNAALYAVQAKEGRFEFKPCRCPSEKGFRVVKGGLYGR